MTRAAAYDEIADWYEEEFLGTQSGSDPLGIRRALHAVEAGELRLRLPVDPFVRRA